MEDLSPDVFFMVLDKALDTTCRSIASIPQVNRQWKHAFEASRTVFIRDASSFPDLVVSAKHGTTFRIHAKVLILPYTVVVYEKAIRIMAEHSSGCVVAVRGDTKGSVIAAYGSGAHLHLENLTLLGGQGSPLNWQPPVGVVHLPSGYYSRLVMVRCTVSAERSFLLQRACSAKFLLGMASAQRKRTPDAVYERGMFGLFAGEHVHVTLSCCTFFGGHLAQVRACKRTNLHIQGCCFLGGKGKASSVVLRDSSLAMKRTAVAYGSCDGMSTYGPHVEVTMQGCAIMHNAEYGVAAHLSTKPIMTRFCKNKVVGNGNGAFFGHIMA